MCLQPECDLNVRTWQPELGVESEKNRPLTLSVSSHYAHTLAPIKKGNERVRNWQHCSLEMHLETPFLRTRIKTPTACIFNSFTVKNDRIVSCLSAFSGLQRFTTLGDPPVFVSRHTERESRRESPKHPQSYFHPDTKQQGCCRGFLLTLYGSVGVQRLPWQPSRSLGLLPLPGRVSPVTARIRRLIKVSFFYAHCRLFFLLFPFFNFL